MKIHKTFSFLTLFGLLSSCNSYPPCNDEVICETYVHRYGMPLDRQDWSQRGQHGQVIVTRKDGVIETRTYDAGILNGECTYTFPHRDVIARKEIYHQGTLVESWEYRLGGTPKKQILYQSPSANTIKAWDERGVPCFLEYYENNLLRNAEYYNDAHEIETNVVEFNGMRTVRDEHGQKIAVETVQDGQVVDQTQYHANGTPSVVTPYRNDVICGERRTYLPTGEPSTIESWNNNQQHGMTYCFEHGERVAEVPYVNGKKHGMERRYRQGNVLVQEVSWESDKKQGPCHNHVGDTILVDWYYNNRLVNKTTYDVLKSQE